MAVKNVLQFGNPMLRKSCIEVEDFGAAEVSRTQEDLKDTLHDLQLIHGKGGGLAAPQIGSSYQVIYIKAHKRAFHLCNPVIIERSQETFDAWDFCFSANASFLAQVTRNQHILVEYHDTAGLKHREQFEGYFSELLQHEIDHLNGILFIDHIEKPETLMMMEEWDKQHSYRQ